MCFQSLVFSSTEKHIARISHTFKHWESLVTWFWAVLSGKISNFWGCVYPKIFNWWNSIVFQVCRSNFNLILPPKSHIILAFFRPILLQFFRHYYYHISIRVLLCFAKFNLTTVDISKDSASIGSSLLLTIALLEALLCSLRQRLVRIKAKLVKRFV